MNTIQKCFSSVVKHLFAASCALALFAPAAAVAQVGATPYAIGNKTIDELSTLSFTVAPPDAGDPVYSLDAAASALGMSINPSTGDFSWTPTEAQGPGTYDVTVTVTNRAPLTPPTVTLLSESFEGLPVGTAINGIGNWTGEDAVVTNVPAGPGADGYTGTLPLDANHERTLHVSEWATYTTNGEGVVVLDMMVKPTLTEEAPEIEAAAQSSCCFDSAGDLLVYHSTNTAATGYAQGWTKIALTPKVTAGDWVRLTITTDYRSSDPANPMFQIAINGVTLSSPLAKATPDIDGAAGGTWFVAASGTTVGNGGATRFNAFDTRGAGILDDVVVQTQGEGGGASHSWTFTITVNEVIAPNFVQIGDVQYASLADAVAAVPADGTPTTITMIADEEITTNEGVVISAGQNVVLDLNGKTISQIAPDAKASYLIQNKGTLMIVDSTAEVIDGDYTSGKLTAMAEHPDAEYGYGNYTIENLGVLTIASGIVEQTSSGSGAYYALNTGAGATATISGGLVKASSIAVRQTSFSSAESTLNITGGTIESGYFAVQLTGMVQDQHSHLNISGGTITTTDATYNFAVYVTNTKNGNFANIHMNITGGTFNGDVATTAAVVEQNMSVSGGSFNGDYGVFSYGSQKFVSGGLFTGEHADETMNYLVDGFCLSATETGYGVVPAVAQIGDVQYATLAEAVAAATAGQTVELLADVTLDAALQVAKRVTLDIGTNSITAAAGCDAIQVLAGANLTINADATTPGHIICDADKHSVYTDNADFPGAKSITINGGVFDGWCEFNQWGTGHSGEKAVPCTVVINGGTFNEQVTGYRCYYFTVNGGTFEKRCEAGVTSTCCSEFRGGKFRISPGSNEPQDMSVGDAAPKKIRIYYTIYFDGEYYNVLGKGEETAAGCVAKAGPFFGYSTLADALKAAQDGDTIEIFGGTWGADAIGTLTTAERASVRGKSLTIQSAEGATVKFTSDVYLGYDDGKTANATMTVKNIAFENARLALVNYVQATVEGCSFTGGNAVAALYISDSCDKTHLTEGVYPVDQVTVRNCTFNGTVAGASAIRLRNSGNVTISDNTIANAGHNGILIESNTAFDNTAAKTVEITGNTITEWNATNVTEGGRGMRLSLGGLASGSTVTITDNVFRKGTTDFDSPDFAKITGAGSATVSLSDNDWNDMLLSEVNGNTAVYTSDVAATIGSVITTRSEPVARIGSQNYPSLAAALAAAVDGDTVTLLENVTYTGADDYPFNITKSITLDGGNHTISRSNKQRLLTVGQNAAGALNVTIKNLVLESGYSGGQALATRKGDITLSLENVTSTATNGNGQPFTVGGSGSNISVAMTNCTLNGGTAGYAITTFNPVTLIADNTTFNAWSAVNAHGPSSSLGSSGSSFTLRNCTVNTPNAYTSDTNAFSAFVLSDLYGVPSNVTFDLQGTSVNISTTGTQYQSLIAYQGGTAVKLIMDAASSVSLTGGKAALFIPGDDIPTDANSQIIVQGATLKAQFEAAGFASTATTYESENGWYVIFQAVAQIGEVQYASLAAAVAAVPADGTPTTITMIADEEITTNEGVVISAGQNVVLDLNGKTISQIAPDAKASYLIQNKGTLTVVDSTAEVVADVYTSGKLTAKAEQPDASYGYGNYTIENFGTLTIESGIVEQTSSGAGAYYALNTREGATATISGGLVKASSIAVRQTSFGSAESTLNITGGTIESGFYAVQLTGMVQDQHSRLNISGGTITTTDTNNNFAVYVSNSGGSFANIHMDITSGTFNGDVATTAAVVEQNMSVSGGTFNGDKGVFSYGTQKFVSGGLFTGANADYTGNYLEDGLCLSATETGYGVVPAVAQIGVVRYETIDAAVAAFNAITTPGDYTIEIIKAGTYVLSDLVIVQDKTNIKSLVVTAADGIEVTLRSGSTASTKTIFSIDGQRSYAGAPVTFRNLTFDLAGNAYAVQAMSGDAVRYAHDLTVEGCAFTNSSGTPRQGYVFGAPAGSSPLRLTMKNCTAVNINQVGSGYFAGDASTPGIRIADVTLDGCKAVLNNQASGAWSSLSNVTATASFNPLLIQIGVQGSGAVRLDVIDSNLETLAEVDNDKNKVGVITVRSQDGTINVKNTTFVHANCETLTDVWAMDRDNGSAGSYGASKNSASVQVTVNNFNTGASIVLDGKTESATYCKDPNNTEGYGEGVNVADILTNTITVPEGGTVSVDVTICNTNGMLFVRFYNGLAPRGYVTYRYAGEDTFTHFTGDLAPGTYSSQVFYTGTAVPEGYKPAPEAAGNQRAAVVVDGVPRVTIKPVSGLYYTIFAGAEDDSLTANANSVLATPADEQAGFFQIPVVPPSDPNGVKLFKIYASDEPFALDDPAPVAQ